jgi:mediator of RNA polymerase II transcription subunit 16, fungi type
VRDGSSYRYESSFVPAFPPWHPNAAKSSLLAVTTNGLLRLIYALNTTTPPLFDEISVELDTIATSDDLISHAAICSEKSRTQRSS